MKKILVIEDEVTVQRFLRETLDKNAYEVRTESNGASGIQAAIEFRPDLVILDLGLPDIDGHAVLEKLREWFTAPILILTARESDADKVRALDHGADDYLTKPFSVQELLARLRLALRHAGQLGKTAVFRSGPLEFDREGNTLRSHGELVKLTATEIAILQVLTRQSGKVVTHRALLKEIWGPNSTEHPQYLRVFVGQLRKKLKASGAVDEFIVTEPGIGYRWVGPE